MNVEQYSQKISTVSYTHLGLNFVGNAAYEEALPEDETEVSQVAPVSYTHLNESGRADDICTASSGD